MQSAHGGSLRCEGIGQIQNWYVILKEENLGFHLNINLSAILQNFSNYTQVYIHIFCIYTVLYCFHWEHQQVEGVQSAHGGSLRFEGIGQIQNWYVILKEENLGFHLNMNCRPFLKTSQIIPKCTFICFCIYTVLYCFHWEHQQVEWVQSAHGGSLRCEGIGQIQNWSVILKEENLGFHLNINLSAILKNFSNYTQVYIHIFFSTLYCIVSTESTSKLKECKVHTEAL